MEKFKQSCLAWYGLWRKQCTWKRKVEATYENLWITMMVWMSKSLSLWKRVYCELTLREMISDLQLYRCIKLCFILSFQMGRVVCFMLNCNKLVLFLITRYRYIFTAWNDKVGTCTLICKSSASQHMATLTDMKSGLFDMGWDIWINVHYNWIIFTG